MFVTICDIFKPKVGDTPPKLGYAIDTMVWEKGETFDQFYSRITEARDDVEEAGGTISDTEMATRLLNALPTTYENFKKNYRLIINFGIVDIDLNSLVSALRTEIQIQNKEEQKEKELKAARAIKSFNAERRKEKFTGKCFTCGKIGHKSIECWHNKPESNRKSKCQSRRLYGKLYGKQVVDFGRSVLKAAPFKLTRENSTHRCDKIYQDMPDV